MPTITKVLTDPQYDLLRRAIFFYDGKINTHGVIFKTLSSLVDRGFVAYGFEVRAPEARAALQEQIANRLACLARIAPDEWPAQWEEGLRYLKGIEALTLQLARQVLWVTDVTRQLIIETEGSLPAPQHL